MNTIYKSINYFVPRTFQVICMSGYQRDFLKLFQELKKRVKNNLIKI